MKKYFILLILCSLFFPVSLGAQDYLFSVPKVEMTVQILPDASAQIRYSIEFQNSPGGHAIDIVDVGMPVDTYDMGQMSAWVNGNPVTGSIRNSEYVKPGVEVHLEEYTIPPGGSGTFQFEATISDLVFQDTTRKDYASFQITPTWFGEQYVQGTTDLTILVSMPGVLNPDEVLSQDVEFTSKQAEEGKVTVGWNTQRRFTSSYRVGVSFPKRVMNRVVSLTISELIMKWWKSIFSKEVRSALLVVAAVCLAVIYFRFTGGTGCVFLVPLFIGAWILLVRHEITEVLIWPGLILLAVVVEMSRKRRKGKYLPAIASVEGGGIKRGLTAPEAAILLELPVNKIVTLILFGMLKKGLIKQVSKDPIEFEPESRPQDSEVVPNQYEKESIELLRRNRGTSMQQLDFSKIIDRLIQSVVQKMKGFDLEETTGYYKHIISRAWLEAKTIGEVETWQKTMDDKIDWMMLDPNFNDRFRPYDTRYIPRSYRPTATTAGTAQPGSSAGSSQSSGPRFTDIAASVSGWFQNTASDVVAKVEGKPGGIVNFAAVDSAVNKAMQSGGSGRSGGGGGGGCACACAGCACACACAGGGR